MKAALVILAVTALFISGCENNGNNAVQKSAVDNTLQPGAISSQAAQTAAKADETLKTLTTEAEKSTDEINKKLPSIIDNIKKLIVILDKEAKVLQKELDKLPKQPTTQPTTTGAPNGQGTSNPVVK